MIYFIYAKQGRMVSACLGVSATADNALTGPHETWNEDTLNQGTTLN